ncbi:MAG: ABC transporter substrate-binding protein [Bradymonadia bacterium]
MRRKTTTIEARHWALLALIFSLAACRGDVSPSAQLPRDQQIVVSVPVALQGPLDPRLNTRAWTGKVIQLMFEGVTTVANPQSVAEPALAARIEQPSPEIYDIYLRPEAKFHDGTDVTAEDVAATWRSTQNKALKSPLKGYYERVKDIEILGPKHLKVTLDGPHSTFLSDMSMGIVPARLIGPDGKLTAPVGAGPYQLHARSGEQEIVLARSGHYHRGQPASPYLTFRAIADQNTRLLALLGGSVDVIQNAVSPVLADAMAKRPGVAVDHSAGVAYAYLGFNLRHPPLDDIRVRQAIAYALDRDRLITHKFKGMAQAATGMLAEGHWAYSDEIQRYPLDRGKARALLDAAGFPRPADGGPRLRLTWTTSTDKFRRNIVELLADDLKHVGVEVKVQAFELGTLLADIKSGNFQMVSLMWSDPSEPHMYDWIFHSGRIPTADAPNRGGNRGAYRNPEVDRLIEAGRVAGRPEARRPFYVQIQSILAEELPYISLWHEDVVVVRRSEVTGFTVLPNNSMFGLWQARRVGDRDEPDP